MNFIYNKPTVVKRIIDFFTIKKPCFCITGCFLEEQDINTLEALNKKVTKYINTLNLQISGDYNEWNISFVIWSNKQDVTVDEKVRKKIALWFKKIETFEYLSIHEMEDESKVFDEVD